MRRGSTSFALVLLASACGSDPGQGPAAPLGKASVILLPSEVSELGAVETVTVNRPYLQDGARKAIADLSSAVANCLRDSLERDPSLAGTIAFTIQLGPRGAPTGLVTKSGSLTSLPSTTCAATVLAKVGMSTGDQGDSIRYAIELKGTYRARAKAEPDPASRLERSTLAFDLASSSDEVAPSALKPIEALDAAVLRCLLGPGIILPSRPVWIAMRVGDDGSVLLDDAGSSMDMTEEEMCVRRKLESVTFPPTRGPFVIEAMYALHAPSKNAPIGDPNGSQPGFRKGRIKAPKAKPPSMRAGATDVSGSLPPEVIHRIVRESFGRFRLCYEEGLRKDPALAGKVVVTFVIAANGDVASASASGDLPDTLVRSCVARAFTTLSFPAPEKGTVKVSYPIIFSPGEGSAASAVPEALPIPKIDDEPLEKVGVVGLERVLRRRDFMTRRLPGSDPTSRSGDSVAVLFRDGLSFGVARVIDGDEVDAECSLSHGGKTLIVTRAGGSCDEVLARIVEK